MMPEMRGGDQRRAIINAGDQVGTIPKVQGQRYQFWIVGDCGNGQDICHVALNSEMTNSMKSTEHRCP